MSLKNWIWRKSVGKDGPTIVAFAGGMGTQIISAAIYFSMKNAGNAVLADLTYFDNPARMAAVGNTGELTHWHWQLEPFGMPRTAFDTSSGRSRRDARVLLDGQAEKLELGLRALSDPYVQKLFAVPPGIGDVLPGQFEAEYLCIHVRRGDYVNVASHLIPDQEFANLVRKFRGLVDNAVIISDSPIEAGLRAPVSACFDQAAFLDDIEPFSAHRVMRNARVLVCSNSTFSLTAAALNPGALALVPRQWFGGTDRSVEGAIHGRCTFQILENALHT